MPRTLICPNSHTFETDSTAPPVCPTCGTSVAAAESIAEDFRTLAPTDDLPPLPTRAPTDAASLVPFQLTGFQILAELGRGGMGVVYQARQINLDRLVALKMILGWASPEDMARFKTEAESLAHLHHPNIVQIHEIGEKDGQPYLALEFIDGGSLAKQLAGTPVESAAAAQMVETLARAIHFAHERRIVHRDLKPANVLLQSVGSNQNVALSRSIPKITDFGLAKRLDRDAGHTTTGSVLGTPSYMAPEQAAGNIDSIGPPADLYALGALLYEMLTGRPPFRAVNPLETIRQVMHDEPVSPRRLQPKVPLDLETICLKCLAKDPAQRYASAAALADDLGAFLAGKPIQARPVNWRERAVKWVKRRPALAGLVGASAVAVLLLVGLVVGAYYNGLLQSSLTETKKQKDRADGLARLNQRYHYLSQMNLAQRFWQENHVPRLAALLDAHGAAGPETPDLRSFEWHYLLGLCRSELRAYAGHEHAVGSIAFSPTENLVASGGGRSTLGQNVGGVGEVHLWDPDTGQLRFALKGHMREVNAVAFSPDGKLLASADSDKRIFLWNVASGEPLGVLTGHAAAVSSLAFDPSGNRLASGGRDGTIKIWDVPGRMSLRDLAREGAVVSSVAFNHDGTRLIAGGFDARQGNAGEIWEWDPVAAKVLHEYRGHRGPVTAVAFHPTGKSFFSAGDDRAIRIWTVGDDRAVRILEGHQDRITSMALDKAGERLASGSADLTAIVWNINTGQELFTRKGHMDTVRGVAFSRDGARLLSASADRTVKVWSAAGRQEYRALHGHELHVTDLAFSPDNALLASASEDGTVRLWDAATGKPRESLTGHEEPARCVAFAKSKNETWDVVSGSDDGTVRFWSIETAKEAFRFDVPQQQIHALALAADAAHLAVAGVSDGDFQAPAAITLWDIERKRVIRTFIGGHAGRITTLAFSPDGKRLVSASADARAALKIWNVADGSEIVSIPLDDATEPRVVWSPDGKSLALANGDVDKGTIRLLDADAGKEKWTLAAHAGMAKALAFTTDGQRLVATAGKRTAASQIKLFDVVTGQEVLTLPGPTGLVRCLAFSPDGRRLAAGGGPLFPELGEIVMWNASRDR
jgi:WD40 repeat protein